MPFQPGNKLWKNGSRKGKANKLPRGTLRWAVGEVARTKPKLFQQALETGLTGKQAHHYLSIAQRVEQADHQPAPTPNVIVLVGNGVEAIGPNPWEGVWAEPVNIEATAPPHVVQVKPPTG